MKRKIFRSEMAETAVNLCDLGFTVAAIAFMLNKSTVNIYNHLKRANRFSGRNMRRYTPAPQDAAISLPTVAAMGRMVEHPGWHILSMSALAKARTYLPETPPAGVTKRTYKKSAKKHA